MNYPETLAWIHGTERFGSRLGLGRMGRLLHRMGDPHLKVPYIHVAGTNGKGSLAAMTSSILTAAGYKTGLTISPYVVDFRERFQIDGEMIPPRTLASLAQKVLDAIDAIELEGGEIPVQFEAVTALALLWFAREKCDLVVLETGLGGRCDATNIVPNKLVAAITKIGLDHTEILGDTLDKIAAEKAGIIKEGCAVVNYPEQPAEAMGPSWVPRPKRTPSSSRPKWTTSACCVASAWKTASTTAVTRPACSSPAPIRPTTPLWLWKLPSPSGGSSATTSPTMPLSRV